MISTDSDWMATPVMTPLATHIIGDIVAAVVRGMVIATGTDMGVSTHRLTVFRVWISTWTPDLCWYYHLQHVL